MAANVTIGKDYFDILLRRAQANENGFAVGDHSQTVTIPKADHENLLNAAHQLENLRRNLFRGGVDEETLNILSSDDPSPEEDEAGGLSRFGERFENKTTKPQGPTFPRSAANGGHSFAAFGNNENNGTNGQYSSFSKQYNGFQNGFEKSPYMSPGPVNGDFFENGNGYRNYGEPIQDSRPRLERNAKRSIELAKLAEGTTLADIVANVRGGMLLDLHMRNDRTCVVSFLHEDDARAFFGYVKRNDLYIRDKRVEIRWVERHHILSGNVANKISIGATRVIIIRNAAPTHTEKLIREHAEHINNLVVISVVFQGKNIVIGCNSVHNSMFLRTCLMSRACYKASKIEWIADECASPMPKPPKKENIQPTKKVGPATTMNRFQCLHNLDGTEDGSAEYDHDTSSSTLNTHVTTNTGIAG